MRPTIGITCTCKSQVTRQIYSKNAIKALSLLRVVVFNFVLSSSLRHKYGAGFF